jgi:hypothetical protein
VTEPLDPVDELLDAYFDFVEGVGEEPSLDHLTAEQRAEAGRLISSLKAAQGIDPEASRPSLAALMARAGTRQEVTRQEVTPPESLGAEMQAALRQSADVRARVVSDVAAQAAGLASALVVYARGLRIRVLVAGEGADVEAAYGARVPAIAAVFGAFPDTNAVLLTTVDLTPLGVIVDRDDIVTAIETPSGRARPPRISRPVLDSTEACVRYLIEAMPAFEPFEHLASRHAATSVDVVDVDHVIEAAIEEVATSGARARLASKKEAWRAIGRAEGVFIAGVLRGALGGEFDETSFRQRIEELVEVA